MGGKRTKGAALGKLSKCLPKERPAKGIQAKVGGGDPETNSFFTYEARCYYLFSAITALSCLFTHYLLLPRNEWRRRRERGR